MATMFSLFSISMITNPDTGVISSAPTGHLHYITFFGLLFLEVFLKFSNFFQNVSVYFTFHPA